MFITITDIIIILIILILEILPMFIVALYFYSNTPKIYGFNILKNDRIKKKIAFFYNKW